MTGRNAGLPGDITMTAIKRNPVPAAKRPYDLIIIGGGIYGIALALEASARGIANLLIEKEDFGWATSYNSLRTIHGGLRYLQKLDLPRFYESVAERRWFLREFPGLVSPLPCLMPLYGNGPYRPSVFRIALTLNDLLSRDRNRNVPRGQELPTSRVIDADEVARLFPLVDRHDLQGGAIWYDGGIPSSQLVLMAMLRQACGRQSTALNYCRADSLLVEGGRVRGIKATDRETGIRHSFLAPRVINAAGPWCRRVASCLDRDDPSLFHYSLAYNILFDRPALSSFSLALKPRVEGARMYFVHGWHNRIMGGTIHEPWPEVSEQPMPTAASMAHYLQHLNLAVPGLNLRMSDIMHVYSGLLPVREQGSSTLTVRPTIKDHGKDKGPLGLYSVAGIKFTTARHVAARLLGHIFPDKKAAGSLQPAPQQEGGGSPAGRVDWDWLPDPNDTAWQQCFSDIITNEAVIHLDDLILRRTTIGDNPRRAIKAVEPLSRLFSWDDRRRREEIKRVTDYFQARRPGRDTDNN